MGLYDEFATVDDREKNDRPESELTCFSPLFLNNTLDVYNAKNRTDDQIKRLSPQHENEYAPIKRTNLSIFLEESRNGTDILSPLSHRKVAAAA